MCSFSSRQFFWEHISGKKCIPFQLGSTFGYISGKKTTCVFVLEWAVLLGVYLGKNVFLFNPAILLGIHKWKKITYVFVFN